MRHSVPLSSRINWRLVALLIAILTFCAAAVLYDGGVARSSTALGRELGSGWTCTPNLIGTVCVKDAVKAAARG